MHFYTYDDWIAHSYSTRNDKEIVKGQIRQIDLSDKVDLSDGKIKYNTALNIKSRFKKTNSVKSNYINNPSFVFPSSTVDCDLGCLYSLSNSSFIPKDSKYKQNGCIQVLDNTVGCEDIMLNEYPYMHLYRPGYENMHNITCETLSINLRRFSEFDKILIFQSIYSGTVSFQEAVTSLDIEISVPPPSYGYDDSSYDYTINTNLYSATSLMIVGTLITFDYTNSGVDSKYVLNIQDISEFVYGHVDMAERYGWNNVLWKTFQPPYDAKVLPSSIMHYSK